MEEVQQRKIIHIDMDAFFASVEQLDFPALKGKPVAVGGSARGGVLAAASYEARKFGVRSAMSGIVAARMCPELIFQKPRFERYSEVSKQIRAIFYEYTDLVEPLSLDEAFLDVTENKLGQSSASLLAQEIRSRVLEATGLTCSAGISINKFTAKIASDINKPNGQCTIPPKKVEAFLDDLPIEKFFGVGKATAQKMKTLGIFFGRDLRKKNQEELLRFFGKQGVHFYDIIRGVQHSKVQPQRLRKSIAAERTFSTMIVSSRVVRSELDKIAEELARRLLKSNLKARTLSLKWKTDDFEVYSKSITVVDEFHTVEQLSDLIDRIVSAIPDQISIRLLGLSASKLNNEVQDVFHPYQLSLDFDAKADEWFSTLDKDFPNF